MRIVIFAGGTGRRLWPISRQRSPKQFEPIMGDKSTLQLAIDRVVPAYGARNVFVSTNERYLEIVRGQLPQLPPANIIGEPARRDLAAAVGLAMAHLAHADPGAEREPVAILWGDSYVQHTDRFVALLEAAARLQREAKAEIFFIGETPRFANENLGWLGLGAFLEEENGIPCFTFESLTYRPSLEACRRMVEAGTHVWNTGYFVTTPAFVQRLYQQYQPAMWQSLAVIEATIGLPDYEETLHRVYPNLPKISFDDAILVHIPREQAAILHGELGWSDPGTLYALKEAMMPALDQNLTKGLVVDALSRDSLLYNYEPHKLVVAVGLEGMIVVNTEDALLVVHKEHIPLVKKVVEGFEGNDYDAFT